MTIPKIRTATKAELMVLLKICSFSNGFFSNFLFNLISAKIVSENFFGGFNKANGDEAQKKNRKEWIEEMIVKSKQIKVFFLRILKSYLDLSGLCFTI